MNRTTFLATLVTLAGLTLCQGCTPATPSTSTPKPPMRRTIFLLVDRSSSTERDRQKLMGATLEIASAFDPAQDVLRLYRFGRTIEETYSGTPEDEEAFTQHLIENLEGSDPVSGTDYPSALQMVAEQARNVSTKEAWIIVLGDGMNDFKGVLDSDLKYIEAGKRLAANPKVKRVRFWGLATGSREEIRNVFKGMGPRLEMLTTAQDPLTF